MPIKLTEKAIQLLNSDVIKPHLNKTVGEIIIDLAECVERRDYFIHDFGETICFTDHSGGGMVNGMDADLFIFLMLDYLNTLDMIDKRESAIKQNKRNIKLVKK